MDELSPHQLEEVDVGHDSFDNQQPYSQSNCSPVVDYYVAPQNAQPITGKPANKLDYLHIVSQQLSGQRMQAAGGNLNNGNSAQTTPLHAQTTPFNQKYLAAGSTTPGSKPNVEGYKANQRNISKFQIFNNQANQVAQFGVENEVYPLANQTFASGGNNHSGDSAFQNYYQSSQYRTPNARNRDVISGRNSFQNASEGIVAGGQPTRYLSTSSSRKNQLHENDLDNLKSTLAQVQNQLPDNIQTRQSPEKKSSVHKQKEPPPVPYVEYSKLYKHQQKEYQKKLYAIRKYQPAMGDSESQKYLPIPGDDRLWKTAPLDRLAAHRKAQKVFVPRSQPRKSRENTRSQAREKSTVKKDLDEQQEEAGWTPEQAGARRPFAGDKSRTYEVKLRNMQLHNKSRSPSPRANKTYTNSASRRGQVEAMGGVPEKQHCQVSTIEFEAKNNDSSFSSDSDFDRNMDEMQSDMLNEQVLKGGEVGDDKAKKKANIIHEVIKEERYEESYTIGASKASPLPRQTASGDRKRTKVEASKNKEPELGGLETEFKSLKVDGSSKDQSRASLAKTKDHKSLDQYIADLQRQRSIPLEQEIDPKHLTEILKKNDEIQKEQAERDKLIEQIYKSLDLRNELLIKYRIESEEYREQMNQFKSFEEEAKHEADKEKEYSSAEAVLEGSERRLSKPTKRKYKSKSSQRKGSASARRGDDQIASQEHEYFPTSGLSQHKLNAFLQRYTRYDLEKKKRIETEKKLKIARESKELVFQPNVSGKRSLSKSSYMQTVRSVDDFLKDQERFKNKLQSKIESARRQKAQKEDDLGKEAKGMSKKSKKILMKASQKKKRRSVQVAALQAKIATVKRYDEHGGTSSSSDEDSMDEGLIVKYVREGENSASLKANSIDDVDEHPRQPQVQKYEFINQFGLHAEVIHTEHLEAVEYVPLLQNKIGGISISKNPLTSRGQPSISDADSVMCQQVNLPIGASKKPQLSNLVIPPKFQAAPTAFRTQRHSQKPLFQDAGYPSNAGDDIILKNQVLNQIMQQERTGGTATDYGGVRRVPNSGSIYSIHESSHMKSSIADNNAMANYFSMQAAPGVPSRQHHGGAAELRLKSMSDLNVNQRASFASNTRTFNCPTDQNTFRKILQNEEDDDLYDDICFTSSDEEAAASPAPQVSSKKKQKRHSSLKRLSYRGSSYSSQNQKKAGRVNGSPNSANLLNRAASQNLYYKRTLYPSKKKQANSFYHQQVATQPSNSHSLDIPSFAPKNAAANGGRDADLLNSLQNSSAVNDSPRKTKQPLRTKNPNSYRNSAVEEKPKTLVSNQTEKMVLKKFNKEFMAAVRHVTGQENIPMKIDCYQFVMLLVQLGGIKQQDIENRHSSEYKKVEEMWLALLKAAQHPLHGERCLDEDKIFVGDAKLLLLASFGIKGNKRLDVEDGGQAKEQRARFPENILPFGWLARVSNTQPDVEPATDKQHQLFLSAKCVKTVRKQFDLLYMNRINTIGRNIEEKKKRRADEEIGGMDFKPSLLTEKMNAKLLQVAQRKPSIEEYMQNRPPSTRARSVSKDYRRFRASQSNWREEQLKLKEMKEMENCTFRPDIQKSASKYKNNMSTYYSTNLSSMAYMPTGTSATPSESKGPGSQASRPEQRPLESPATVQSSSGLANQPASQPVEVAARNQAPTKKLELAGMQRFEQLYQVGKAHSQARKILSQLPSDQRDFEKQKEECTFKPARIAKGPKKKIQEKGEASPSKEVVQGIFKDYKEKELLHKLKAEEILSKEQDEKNAPKRRVQALKEKSQQQAIQRYQQAIKERAYIQYCKQYGKAAKLLQNAGKSTGDAMTPTQAEDLIKGVTDRLTMAKKSSNVPKVGSSNNLPPPLKKRQATPNRDYQKVQKVIPMGLRFKANKFEPVLKGHRSRDVSPPPKYDLPMMYVDVFVDSDGEPIKHRIPVFRGDQAGKLAEKFCIQHGYDLDTQDNLEQSLRQKIGEVVSKISNSSQVDEGTMNELQTILNPLSEDLNTQLVSREGSRLFDGQLQQIPEINEVNQDLEKSEEEQPQVLLDEEQVEQAEESLLDDDQL